MATNNVLGARKLFKSLSLRSNNRSERNGDAAQAVQRQDSVALSDVVSMDGLFKYEDLVGLLSCGMCGKFCGQSIVQCRKGHVICRACKTEQKVTSCKECKQTFVDAPNVVLEKLVNMIALPCRFRQSGCTDFIFPDQKIDHETFCPCRPIACQYASSGCQRELPYKEISSHHRQCDFNPRSNKKS